MSCDIEKCKFWLCWDEPEKRDPEERVEVYLDRGDGPAEWVTLPSHPTIDLAVAWCKKWAKDRGFEAYLKPGYTTGTGIDLEVFLRNKETA